MQLPKLFSRMAYLLQSFVKAQIEDGFVEIQGVDQFLFPRLADEQFILQSYTLDCPVFKDVARIGPIVSRHDYRINKFNAMVIPSHTPYAGSSDPSGR